MRQDLYQELYTVEDTHWWHQHKRAVVRGLLQRFSAFGRVLDVGAGTGKILAELQANGWQVVGVDGEKEAVEWSKKRGLDVKLIDLQQKQLPFKEHEFSAVMALDLLEHVDDDVEVLEQMQRVLSDKGVVVITVPAYQQLFSYWDTMLGHKRRYSKGELDKKLKKAGLKPLYVSYYFCLPLLPSILVRWIKRSSTKSSQQATSDFQTTPLSFISVPLLNAYLWCERVIMRFATLPFGLSVVAVATKKS